MEAEGASFEETIIVNHDYAFTASAQKYLYTVPMHACVHFNAWGCRTLVATLERKNYWHPAKPVKRAC